MPGPSLRQLTQRRADRQQHQKAVLAAAEKEREAAARLATLAARGVTGTRLTAARKRVDDAHDRLTRAQRSLEAAIALAAAERAALDETLHSPEAAVAQLSTQHPVLLAPVRIETRFFPGELRVRIFPDVFHVDSHEVRLTAAEQAWGEAYWRTRWELSDPNAIARLWADTVAGVPSRRAAWVVEAMAPTNVDRLGQEPPQFAPGEVRPPGPSTAPVARLLPSRWLVTAYRGDEAVAARWGGVIPDDLPVAPKADLDDAAADDHSELPDEQPGLPDDDALAWLTDFDEAAKRGMAVTIRDADVAGGRVQEGFDQLVVVGVDWTRTPEQARTELDRLMDAQAHTRGLSFVPAGTVTNATADRLPPPPSSPGDPTVATQPPPGTASSAFLGAIGGDGRLLGRLAGADVPLNPATAATHVTLWEPTMGYLLRQFLRPVVPEPTIGRLRSHFVDWVRPRGPLPHVRIGQQPYGVLPVMAATGFRGGSDDEELHGVLTRMRPFWTYRSAALERLGQSGDPSEDLVDLLRRNERSQEVRIRRAFGPAVAGTIAGMDQRLAVQAGVARAILRYLGTDHRPPIVDLYVDDEQEVLPIALVQPHPVSDTEPLRDNYIGVVRSHVYGRGPIAPLREQANTATSLFQALVAHAATIELSRAGLLLVVEAVSDDPFAVDITHHLVNEEISILDDAGRPIDPMVAGATVRPVFGPATGSGTTAGRTAEPSLVAQAESLLQKPLIEMIESPLASEPAARSIADQVRAIPQLELVHRPFGVQLAQFRSALATLETLPSAELQRLAAESLDVVSHRLDAWITSMASKRLAELRADQPDGVHIGGFGWVEDVRPRPATASAGFVHGASVAHATTAAVLRSGHLSHGAAGTDGGDEWLAVDLSSKRVRMALELLDGVRSGQPVGALLGYRFERGLRDLGFDFAGYIHDFRQRFPLDERADRTADGEPLEAVGAGDVVDGAALAELTTSQLTTILTTLAVADDHRDAVRALIAELGDAVDATGDLLVAEGVHQAVLGNTERSAAALDALDRQVAIPDLGIVKTPRTGRGCTHRVLALLRGGRPSGWATDTRARLAPELNEWVGRVLGGPDRYHFVVEGLDDEGAVTQSITVPVATLRLSPLSAVLATRRSNEDATELEQRLNAAVASQLRPEVVALRPGPAPSGVVGFDEFVWRAQRIADFMASSRPATARDFVAPDHFASTDPGLDLSLARARADAAAAAVSAALEGLGGIDGTASKAALRSALARAADLGLRGAVALGDKDRLHQQVAAILPQVQALAEEVAAIGLDGGSDPRLEAERCQAVVRAALGQGVPVVLPVRLPAPTVEELGRSSIDGPLVDARAVDAPDLLFQHSLVREGIGRFQAVLDDAEALDLTDASLVGTAQLLLGQLPHVPGDPWLGAPLDTPGRYPAGQLSLLVHDPAADGLAPRLDLGGPLAALTVDQWNDFIPHPSETTAVSFHYDAPGARPPQSLIVAVPSDRSAKNWTSGQLVDTVREALALSKIRMLDLDDVGISRILPATYVPFSLEPKAWSVDFAALLPLAFNALMAVRREDEEQ